MKIIRTAYRMLMDLCLAESVKIFECALFWKNLWWWKLNYYTSILYLWDSRFRIVLREGNKGPYSLNNYTPGETSLITVMKIIRYIAAPDLPFIDLGSGRGYAKFGAALLFGCPVTGVEILPGYVKKCEIIKEKLAVRNSEIMAGDMLSMPVTRKAIYFCTATAFDGNLVQDLENKLSDVPSGSWVVIVHYPFKTAFFSKAYKGEEALPFTWGWDTVYFYKIE